MATPAELALMPPIPRTLPPEVQAMLLAQRLGIQPPSPAINSMMPPVPPGTGPLPPPALSVPQVGSTFPMPAAAPPTPVVAPPGNVPYAGGMAAQQPQQRAASPLGAVINPAAGIPVDPFQGPPEPERAPPTNEGQPVGPAQTQQGKPRRLQAWRDFIQKFKTDPDTRMSVMQSIIALTQPSNNAAESIGNALDVGQKTLHSLQTQRFEQGRQTSADQREERQVVVQEKGQDLNREQAQTRKDQGQQELDTRLKSLEQDAAYQQELLKIRKMEALGEAGQQGQVNQRWSQLAEAMLAQPDEDLLKFPEGEQRRNRARLRAFDAINTAGQTRQKFLAEEIARQQVMAPDADENPEEYLKWSQSLYGRVGSFADAAGLFDERVAPPGRPGTPASSGPPKVLTDADYNKLPKGAQFLDPQGNLRVKP